MRSLLLLGVLVLVACRSSAPYTVTSAILNSAVAGVGSAQQRAADGCWALCTHGTTCNPKTGLCESEPVPTPPNEVCREEPGGGVRCIPFEITAQRPAGGASASGVGVSPATGSVPPPPSEASPRGP